MKRFTIFILALFCLFINTQAYAASTYTQKNITTVAEDGFILKAKLTYPKIKAKKQYSTVILLHSLGTNSDWWGSLPESLLENGYAVLSIDLRGHGASVYNSKLVKVSWKSLTNNSFRKYPSDVIQIINNIKDEYPRMTFFDNYVIVGSDIGASAGVIAADKLKVKPASIVLLSPVVQTRGLYIPVSIAQLDVDFLSISSTSDETSVEAEKYLKKFAQKEFQIYDSQSNHTGMIILKNDPEIVPIITEWIKQYLN